MYPTVIVTHASQIGDENEQNQKKSEIATAIGARGFRVFTHENYTVQGEKFMGIDKRTMCILHRILEDAVDYHKRNTQDLKDDIVNQEASRTAGSTPNTQVNRVSQEASRTGGSTPNTQVNRVSGKSLPATPPQAPLTKPVQGYPKIRPFQKGNYKSPGAPATPPPASGLRCSICKEEVESDWDNCAYCSSPIPKQKKPIPSKNTISKPAKKFCPNSSCNNEVEDNWEICPCCEGYLKRPATCCNIPVRPNFAFCPKCKKIFPK
jgi:hypothetical protein